jgi:hypothetical protein
MIEMKFKLQLKLCFSLKESTKSNVREVKLWFGISALILRILFFSDVTLCSGVNRS